jgi:hypothetical protein
MRLINVSLLLCGLAAVCAAQAARSQPGPPDIAVYNYEWRAKYKTVRPNDYGLEKRYDYAQNDPANPERQRRNRGEPSADPQRLEMPAPPRPARRELSGYESSLQLKNIGPKVITAVEWAHVFFSDKAKQQELKRFNFRRKAKIEPGEQKIIAQVLPSDRYFQLTPSPRQSVVINRVEYADGTVWQRQ